MAKNDGTRLATALHKALRGSKSAVDAGLLLGELMQVWGGPARLARDMYAEFEAAPKGSMVRQRMMEAVQRLVVQATDRDQTKVIRPETMTDEDLEAMAMSSCSDFSPRVGRSLPTPVPIRNLMRRCGSMGVDCLITPGAVVGMCREAAWKESHAATASFLGSGILYYSFTYMLKAKVAVCLGSGGGFVPRLMRQA